MASSREENKIITFNRNKSEWHNLNPKTSKIHHRSNWAPDFTTLVLNEYLYVFFHPLGFYRIKYSDPDSGWTQLSDLLDNHGWYTPCTTWNGSIFVAGTTSLNEMFNSAERYIVHLDKWVRIRNTKKARNHPGIIGAAGYVYLIGGWDYNFGKMKSVERYDLRTDRWEEVAPTPRVTNFTSAIEKGKSIYVVDDAGVMDYNITTNSWTIIQFEKRWPFMSDWFNRLLPYEGSIVCIGKLENCYAVYSLDIEKGKCKLMEKMKHKDIWAIQTVSVKL